MEVFGTNFYIIMKRFIGYIAVFYFTLFIFSCGDDTVVTTPEPHPYDIASFSKGGIMFDRFWSPEAGFNQSDTNILLFNSKPDFFRCSHCHGWDLLGRFGSSIGKGPNAGRPNVAGMNLYSITRTKAPQELYDLMKVAGNRRNISYDFSAYVPADPNDSAHKMPNYEQILTSKQLWDLVKYLKEGVHDVTGLYDASYSGIYPTGSASFYNIGKDGNSSDGLNYYSANCSSCHGTNGMTILVESMTVGEFTRTKPFEVHHKVKYGQQGSSMSGKFDITLNQVKDLYKAISDTAAFPDRR